MREDSLLRLFHIITTYPLYSVSFLGFAVMHYHFANRLGCYGFLRNLLYTAACMAVATALFFTGALLVRYTGMSSMLSSQLIVGFGFAAIVVTAGRIFFRTQPKPRKSFPEA